MDYNDCVLLINSTASKDTEVRTISADVYELGPELGIREYGAQEAAAFINSINRLEGGNVPQPRPTQQAQEKPRRVEQPSGTAARRPLFGKVAGELETALASKPKPAPQPQVEEGDLVLPKLSLQDQISELEKIGVGIDSGAFDDEQMAIIRREVGALKKTPIAPTDKIQKNLVGMRNARLKEVSKKLGM
jgi:hypothetical protein